MRVHPSAAVRKHNDTGPVNRRENIRWLNILLAGKRESYFQHCLLNSPARWGKRIMKISVSESTMMDNYSLSEEPVTPPLLTSRKRLTKVSAPVGCLPQSQIKRELNVLMHYFSCITLADAFLFHISVKPRYPPSVFHISATLAINHPHLTRIQKLCFPQGSNISLKRIPMLIQSP